MWGTTTPADSQRLTRVRSQNTLPEKRVRQALTQLGFRYRLARRDLPGCPDIVLPGQRLAIFVHGCFWHRHRCKAGQSAPIRNAGQWQEKFRRTQVRDRQNIVALRKLGWRVAVIWECHTTNPRRLSMILRRLLRPTDVRRKTAIIR